MAPEKMTEQQYLEFERTSAVRHEFFDGALYAMAGASEAHNLITVNLTAALHAVVRQRPCVVYASDMRIKIESAGLYTYPDVTVACGERRFLDERRDTLLNPLLVVEVLSESTERYDRGQKFEWYRTVPSITDVLLVSQEKPFVEQYSRQGDNSWVLHERRAGDRVVIAPIQCEIAVDEIYFKVFPG